jgi:hypothetical protein
MQIQEFHGHHYRKRRGSNEGLNFRFFFQGKYFIIYWIKTLNHLTTLHSAKYIQVLANYLVDFVIQALYQSNFGIKININSISRIGRNRNATKLKTIGDGGDFVYLHFYGPKVE